jgi:hypothetical protein
MKCSEILLAWESANWFRRRAARRHAARCAECAQAVQALAVLKQQLAAIDTISLVERHQWMKAAHSAPAPAPLWPSSFSRRVLGGACAAAAAILIAWGGWYALRPGPLAEMASRHKTPLASAGAPHLTIQSDPAIRQGLVNLSAQLDVLSRQAALLDEQRELRALVQQSP